jgi:transcriptional regulator with XRE-family HTH domain
VSANVFNTRMAKPPRPSVDRAVQRRLRAVVRGIGTDLCRIRTDGSASQARVAHEAGIDRSHLGRIEAGTTNASLETLVAVATAMGADVSVRFFPGSGPRITDRHQARMIEALLRGLSHAWRPHLEVPVFRPARGYVDAVFERTDDPLLVVSEAQSTLPRLEQQIRWAAEKAASIGSSELVGSGPIPATSKLLIVRSTASTRELARSFEATLRTAYPARSRDAVRSLLRGSPWPGDAIIWIRIEGERVEILDGPPRGVAVGR